MKNNIQILLAIVILVAIASCVSETPKEFTPKEIYKSSNLIVTQLSENGFLHTSYKQTTDFGNVPCNGLFVRSGNEIIIFDTPTNDKSSLELIKFINNPLKGKIKAVVPTHFHDDCLGGLKAFHENGIPSFANSKTIELAKENNEEVPNNGFIDSLALTIGNETVKIKFFGEGHTIDNVIGYFPSDKILFGGCLIKELDANEGYLGDANLAEWSNTVAKIKKAYPDVNIVVPGHGKFGDITLFDYTINLFKTKKNK